LKINGSLARKALADLEEKGVIKKVVGHSKLSIYSEFYLPARNLFGGGRAELLASVELVLTDIIARAVAAAE